MYGTESLWHVNFGKNIIFSPWAWTCIFAVFKISGKHFFDYKNSTGLNIEALHVMFQKKMATWPPDSKIKFSGYFCVRANTKIKLYRNMSFNVEISVFTPFLKVLGTIQ